MNECLQANKCAMIMKEFVADRKRNTTTEFNKKTLISQE